MRDTDIMSAHASLLVKLYGVLLSSLLPVPAFENHLIFWLYHRNLEVGQHVTLRMHALHEAACTTTEVEDQEHLKLSNEQCRFV